MRFRFSNILILFFVFSFSLNATKKDADQVFGRWMQIQQIIPQMDVSEMSNELSNKFFDSLRSSYDVYVSFLKTTDVIFNPSNNSDINWNTLDFDESFASQKEIRENINKIHQLLEKDIVAFVQYLIDSGLADGVINAQENRIGSSLVIDKYRSLFDIIFFSDDFFKKIKYLFNVANRFYDYCFRDFSEFKTIIENDKFHPIARLLYTVIWYHLAGQGWKNWHESALDNLKKAADQGKEIVYIAGGVDIYQMIKKGVYNIRIIDPILPTQPKYYSEGWMWLYKGDSSNGGIGDEIYFAFADKKVLMRRVAFTQTDKIFKRDLSTGVTADIPKGQVTWDIFENGLKVGQFVIERRLSEQKDFQYNSNKQLLMSFNELHFISLPSVMGGWGINTYKFDEKLRIIVKQLSKPVSAQTTKNMRMVLENNNFNFISLGTCVN